MCLLLAASVLGSKLDLSPWLRAPRQLAGAGDTGGVAALGLVTALQQWAEQLETEGSTVGIYLHIHMSTYLCTYLGEGGPGHDEAGQQPAAGRGQAAQVAEH